MVEVMLSHQAIGGMPRELSCPPPRTATFSYDSARSASGVVIAASRRRTCASEAECGNASSAASRPARISMNRL